PLRPDSPRTIERSFAVLLVEIRLDSGDERRRLRVVLRRTHHGVGDHGSSPVGLGTVVGGRSAGAGGILHALVRGRGSRSHDGGSTHRVRGGGRGHRVQGGDRGGLRPN